MRQVLTNGISRDPVDLAIALDPMPRSESTRILLIASVGSMSGLLLKGKPSLCVWSLDIPIFLTPEGVKLKFIWGTLRVRPTTYGEKFNIQKAGMTRSMWSEMALETPLNKEVPA